MPVIAPRLLFACAAVALLAFAGTYPARAAANGLPATDSVDTADRGGALRAVGFENVTAGPGESTTVAFENRRWRHAALALGVAHRQLGASPGVFVRRLGAIAARVEVSGPDSTPRFRVRYPSDPSFPPGPRDPIESPAFARATVSAGPVIDYRIGQLFDPLQVRLEIQPRLLLNPWAGAVVRAALLIPVVNDYPAGDIDRDAGRFRPGRTSLDQYVWIPRVALASVSAGYFGGHRWGVAGGMLRPLFDGAVALDAEIERTGYLAFASEATFYSNPETTSGWAGISYRPWFADATLRLRGGQFLYGDRGAELELRRRFDDIEIGYFVQRTVGIDTYGLRLDLPIPPALRSSGSRVRVQPDDAFGISFRDEGSLIGTWVSGVANREDYLRQLNRPELEANRGRYLAARAGGRPGARPTPEEGVSFSGMTGFIHVPWAGVMPDRGIEAGYAFEPRRWAYDHRGTNDNQIFYATMGFLPHIEAAMRWTRIPGYHSFQEIVPDSRLVDVDRLSSGRVEILAPARNRPGLAAGIDDVQGTRRFHSTYAVTGIPFSIFHLESRAAFGYGFRALEANRHVLDGAFGAAEIDPTRFLRVQAEYDTEKWNAGLGVLPGAGFRIRAALLNLESVAWSVGWAHTL